MIVSNNLWSFEIELFRLAVNYMIYFQFEFLIIKTINYSPELV